MNKNNFEAYNESLMEEGLPPWRILAVLQLAAYG
jgi:hypothetical protein